MTGPRVLHLVVGPAAHGVTEHSRHLAAACGHPSVDDVDSVAVDDRTVVHLSFTEALFGPDARAAVNRVCGFTVAVHNAGGLVTTTLHDIPQPAEGSTRYQQRRGAYQQIVSACDGIVYNSEHERRLAREANLPNHPVEAVVTLPLWAPPPTFDGPGLEGLDAAAVVFGHLYPGKGHSEAIEFLAASDVVVPKRLIALGACSPSHNDLTRELGALGTTLGVEVRVTGHVPDGRVLPALRRAGIPVAPHRHISASGSIAAWVAAGRRPLVADSQYTAELEDRWPGCVYRVPPGAWPDALAAAAREPEITRSGATPRWGWPEIGRAYLRFFSEVAER